MKGKTLMEIGLFITLAGVLVIIFGKRMGVGGIDILIGVAFMLVGIVNFIFFATNKEDSGKVSRLLTLMANAAAVVLGLSMVIFESTFKPLVAFVFAVVIGLCALWQLFVLAFGTRPYKLPTWLYAFPALIAIASIFLFTRDSTQDEDAILIGTGVGLTLMGVASLIEGIYLGLARRADRKMQEAANDPRYRQAPIDVNAIDQSRSAYPVRRRNETTDNLDAVNTGRRSGYTTDDLDDVNG